MIPKILHYVWVGPRSMPDEDHKRVEAWRVRLPDWTFSFWGNNDVDFESPYLREAFAVRAWNRVSDYTRMAALAQFGGVYLDTDVEVVRDLEPLLQHHAFLGCQNGGEEPDEIVNGAVLGAEPGHWLPRTIRTYFDEKLSGRADLGAFSGPGLLTQVLREHGLQSYVDDPIDVDGVTVMPKRYFYPYGWRETFSDAVITSDTFAIHHWAATWVRKPTFRFRARRKALDLSCRLMPALALRIARATAGGGNKTG
ncbi:MAG: hypothetical protein JO001_24990 [Alphaproteobacteria bacterium]|nr:hypothetical protein [Alphaproteobacteria bacterium]